MGELMSIREIIKRFGKDQPVYTAEYRPSKKPSQKVKSTQKTSTRKTS